MIPEHDSFSRAAKALTDSGLVDRFDDALALLARSVPQIVVGPDATSLGHQAALLTAVQTTRRSFGTRVTVALPDSVARLQCELPGLSRMTIGAAIADAGGTVIESGNGQGTSIVIGEGNVDGERSLQVTWDGWAAHVSVAGARMAEGGNMSLAPVASAALAVAECFKAVLGDLEASYRDRYLDLWSPDVPLAEGQRNGGPALKYLPASAWLVGLGHLGQAYAWCLRLLPYVDRGAVCFVLQDFDRVTDANQSTGLFVEPGHLDELKTRVLADALEDAGFETRLIERPLTADLRRTGGEPALALLGLDKVGPRRLISSVGWNLAVDVGLGGGPVDFTGINLHTFPAAGNSGTLAAFNGVAEAARGERALEAKAYKRAVADAERVGDERARCGVVMVAGAAVAAPFVGVIAACLAIAEPLRQLHGADATASAVFDAGGRAPARRATSPCTARIPFVDAGGGPNTTP